MFQIKICGITTIADAAMTARAGADAIGLNFYRPSPRSVDLARAAAIRDVLPAEVAKIGVFVNHEEAEIRELVDAAGLDQVQLHGDEPWALVERLQPLPVIRALRIGDQPLPAVVGFCREAADRGAAAILLDAFDRRQFGGTGQTCDWQLAAEVRRQSPLPLVLAGGLNPENVAAAIRQVGPRAVDTASGVESAAGVKSASATADFVREAAAAFRRLR